MKYFLCFVLLFLEGCNQFEMNDHKLITNYLGLQENSFTIEKIHFEKPFLQSPGELIYVIKTDSKNLVIVEKSLNLSFRNTNKIPPKFEYSLRKNLSLRLRDEDLTSSHSYVRQLSTGPYQITNYFIIDSNISNDLKLYMISDPVFKLK